MTCELIKLIAERNYQRPQQNAADYPHDVRVMHVPPHMAENIRSWYEASGWAVSSEEI